MKKFFRFYFLLVFLLFRGPIATAEPLSFLLASKIKNDCFYHNGYQFDISQVLNDEHLEDILYQLELQVYFIEVLNLPQEIQDLFKSSPISVIPSATEKFNGAVIPAGSIVLLADKLIQRQSYWRFHKLEDPILLHRFFTVFLDQYLPRGSNNPDISKYFSQAKSLPCYQAKNPEWISNASSQKTIDHFFANAAISYLRGSYSSEPSSCYEIQKNQPKFFHYLENLFGPKSGFLNQCFSYHGFNFNWSQINDFSHYQEVCDECAQQVGFIELAGLPKNITDFFKTVPLNLEPELFLTMTRGNYGLYNPLNQNIALNATAFCDPLFIHSDDATLLHELLHAFHDQVLPNGNDNPSIDQFFKEAQQQHCYDSEQDPYIDYLMTNKAEFFACTAMAFLDDFAPYEPFNRKNIFTHQPDYYLYLQSIFGPHQVTLTSPST